MGIALFDSFESQQVAETGMVPMPQSNEQCIGGHAVCVVGYDNSKQMFLVRNSWGSGWGDKGYFYIAYEYFKSYASDCWTCR